MPRYPEDWQLVDASAPKTRLIETANKIFKDDASVRRYADPKALNELFTWTGFLTPWPLEAFVLQHGIGRGEALEPHTLENVATIVGKSLGLLRNAHILKELRFARWLHEQTPEGHGTNELRMVGLKPGIWRQLAYQGGALSLDRLCELSEDDLLDIRGFGPSTLRELKNQLGARRRTLRS